MTVYADVIPLTSLSIIRGRTLFEHFERSHSVFISNNYDPVRETTVGLRELQLPLLHGQLFVPLHSTDSAELIVPLSALESIYTDANYSPSSFHR